MAIHAQHLPCIRPESDPVKEACKDIKHPLQPLQLGRGDKYIVGLKLCRQVPYRQSKSLHARLCCRHHCHLVADYGVHDHVEDHGVQGFSLGKSVVSLEGRAIITSGPVHHCDPAPVRLEEPERPGAYPVLRENLYASILL